MAKESKKEETLPTGTNTTVIKPELNNSSYVFFRDPKTGNFCTAKVEFDSELTTAQFSEIEIAGGEKSLAIERLKILLATKVF